MRILIEKAMSLLPFKVSAYQSLKTTILPRPPVLLCFQNILEVFKCSGGLYCVLLGNLHV